MKVPKAVYALSKGKTMNFNTKSSRERSHNLSTFSVQKSRSKVSKGIKRPMKLMPLRDMSYLSIKKTQNVGGEKSKLTWNSLENMRLNDLRGYMDKNFNPGNMIAQEDPEDHLYLNEYGLAKDKKKDSERKERSIRTIKSYGKSNHFFIS